MVSKIWKFVSKVPRPFPHDVSVPKQLTVMNSWWHLSFGTKKNSFPHFLAQNLKTWRCCWFCALQVHGNLGNFFQIHGPWLSNSLLLPFFPKAILKIVRTPWAIRHLLRRNKKTSHFWNLLPTSKSWHPPEPGAVKSPGCGEFSPVPSDSGNPPPSKLYDFHDDSHSAALRWCPGWCRMVYPIGSIGLVRTVYLPTSTWLVDFLWQIILSSNHPLWRFFIGCFLGGALSKTFTMSERSRAVHWNCALFFQHFWCTMSVVRWSGLSAGPPKHPKTNKNLIISFKPIVSSPTTLQQNSISSEIKLQLWYERWCEND